MDKTGIRDGSVASYVRGDYFRYYGTWALLPDERWIEL